MSILDSQVLSKQHADKIRLEILTNTGEKIIKRVELLTIVDTNNIFCFLADKLHFIVIGNKGNCMKREITYKKSMVLLIVVMAALVIFQSIYTMQVAEVYFWIPKRSDIVAYVGSSVFLFASAFILTEARDTFIAVRQASIEPFWLPLDADYTFKDWLKERPKKDLKISLEVLKSVSKKIYGKGETKTERGHSNSEKNG